MPEIRFLLSTYICLKFELYLTICPCLKFNYLCNYLFLLHFASIKRTYIIYYLLRTCVYTLRNPLAQQNFIVGGGVFKA